MPNLESDFLQSECYEKNKYSRWLYRPIYYTWNQIFQALRDLVVFFFSAVDSATFKEPVVLAFSSVLVDSFSPSSSFCCCCFAFSISISLINHVMAAHSPDAIILKKTKWIFLVANNRKASVVKSAAKEKWVALISAGVVPGVRIEVQRSWVKSIRPDILICADKYLV